MYLIRYSFICSSLVYTKTFIQVLSTMLPDHASIICLDKKIPTYLNIDAVVQDLKELRRVFMEYLDGQIMIPRKQWNIIRSKLVSIFIKTCSIEIL